jgi:hypothetical protein
MAKYLQHEAISRPPPWCGLIRPVPQADAVWRDGLGYLPSGRRVRVTFLALISGAGGEISATEVHHHPLRRVGERLAIGSQILDGFAEPIGQTEPEP